MQLIENKLEVILDNAELRLYDVHLLRMMKENSRR
jgi:hypothetical protein